jgi:ubiquinone/menaquinone biosynthesis C-methylase UbiE
MSTISDRIRDGHFARKQLLTKQWLIGWSHQRRFQVGVDLTRKLAGQRLLDYGCGDGTFLAMLRSTASYRGACFGAEVLSTNVQNCRDRFAGTGINFVLVDELTALPQAYFDVIVCMEVLEHLVDVDATLKLFTRLLAPPGRLIISVPVETGIPLLVKQLVRSWAGWRGIGDYPGTSSYEFPELVSSVFANCRQSIARSVHRDGNNDPFHDHKGFNWMALRKKLEQQFQIERTIGSPLTWLTPHLGSQVWFVASPKN